MESLDISSHFDESDSSPSESSDSPSEPKRPESQPQQQKDEAEPPSDRSVFMYYFKAIRGHNNTMQVFLIVTQGVIASFRCKNPLMCGVSFSLLTAASQTSGSPGGVMAKDVIVQMWDIG